MAEELDSAPDRRASWVALRTLRQRPTVVGRTDTGETVYDIRSVRVVLPAGAAHFHRLVPCARCGRDVRGTALVSSADLDHAPNPMFCERCVGAPMPAPEPRPAGGGRPEPALVPTPVARAPEPAAARAVDPLALARLAKLEARVADIVARLGASGAVESELRQLSTRVNTALDDHQDQLGKLSASETEVRSELWEVTASTRELGRLQAELNQRLVELAEQVAAPPPPPHPDAEQHRAALLDEVGELRAALAGLDDRVAEQAAALKLLEHQQQDNGAGLRAEIAKLEQDSVRLTGVVETHYHETKQALEETGRMVIQSLSEPLRDLAQAHQEADARLLELERRAEATVADVVAHNGSAEPASSGLRALEDQLDAVATAMAEISAQISEVADAGGEHASRQRELDRQTSELAGRLATLEDRLAGIETTVAEGGVQSRSRPMPADGALDLLGGLERQLRQAEGRLSKLNADAPWAPAPEG